MASSRNSQSRGELRYFKGLQSSSIPRKFRNRIRKRHRALSVLDRPIPAEFDLLVFAHIRWNLVFQRPQHLMTRWAKERRVVYIEEPVFGATNGLEISKTSSGVSIITPQIASEEPDPASIHRYLLDEFFENANIREYLFWYLTPMALEFTKHLHPALTVYDCMDELSGFAGAPQGLREKEKELLARSDLVFTGGQTLYEAKCREHHNIHPFPSSIDFHHFEKARQPLADPQNQLHIAGLRIGFFGVIDERMDLELVEGMARQQPNWNFILIGPVVKIDPATLPKLPNIHYLGRVEYTDLPSYLASWDVAILPFARNDATRFISPTKTPEYLAAGRPVVSTSIRDVVRPYAELGLVHIADHVPEFVAAIEQAFSDTQNPGWIQKVDAHLAGNSWDKTWSRMNQLLTVTFNEKRQRVRGPKSVAGGVKLPKDQPIASTYEDPKYV